MWSFSGHAFAYPELKSRIMPFPHYKSSPLGAFSGRSTTYGKTYSREGSCWSHTTRSEYHAPGERLHAYRRNIWSSS